MADFLQGQGEVALPPRKRLLAGLKQQNGWTSGTSPSPSPSSTLQVPCTPAGAADTTQGSPLPIPTSPSSGQALGCYSCGHKGGVSLSSFQVGGACRNLCQQCAISFAKKKYCPHCFFIYDEATVRDSPLWIACVCCIRFTHVSCQEKVGGGAFSHKPYRCADCISNRVHQDIPNGGIVVTKARTSGIRQGSAAHRGVGGARGAPSFLGLKAEKPDVVQAPQEIVRLPTKRPRTLSSRDHGDARSKGQQRLRTETSRLGGHQSAVSPADIPSGHTLQASQPADSQGPDSSETKEKKEVSVVEVERRKEQQLPPASLIVSTGGGDRILLEEAAAAAKAAAEMAVAASAAARANAMAKAAISAKAAAAARIALDAAAKAARSEARARAAVRRFGEKFEKELLQISKAGVPAERKGKVVLLGRMGDGREEQVLSEQFQDSAKGATAGEVLRETSEDANVMEGVREGEIEIPEVGRAVPAPDSGLKEEATVEVMEEAKDLHGKGSQVRDRVPAGSLGHDMKRKRRPRENIRARVKDGNREKDGIVAEVAVTGEGLPANKEGMPNQATRKRQHEEGDTACVVHEKPLKKMRIEENGLEKSGPAVAVEKLLGDGREEVIVKKMLKGDKDRLSSGVREEKRRSLLDEKEGRKPGTVEERQGKDMPPLKLKAKKSPAAGIKKEKVKEEDHRSGDTWPVKVAKELITSRDDQLDLKGRGKLERGLDSEQKGGKTPGREMADRASNQDCNSERAVPLWDEKREKAGQSEKREKSAHEQKVDRAARREKGERMSDVEKREKGAEREEQMRTEAKERQASRPSKVEPREEQQDASKFEKALKRGVASSWEEKRNAKEMPCHIGGTPRPSGSALPPTSSIVHKASHQGGGKLPSASSSAAPGGVGTVPPVGEPAPPSLTALDDEELARQLHRAMNSSPRISGTDLPPRRRSKQVAADKSTLPLRPGQGFRPPRQHNSRGDVTGQGKQQSGDRERSSNGVNNSKDQHRAQNSKASRSLGKYKGGAPKEALKNGVSPLGQGAAAGAVPSRPGFGSAVKDKLEKGPAASDTASAAAACAPAAASSAGGSPKDNRVGGEMSGKAIMPEEKGPNRAMAALLDEVLRASPGEEGQIADSNKNEDESLRKSRAGREMAEKKSCEADQARVEKLGGTMGTDKIDAVESAVRRNGGGMHLAEAGAQTTVDSKPRLVCVGLPSASGTGELVRGGSNVHPLGERSLDAL